MPMSVVRVSIVVSYAARVSKREKRGGILANERPTHMCEQRGGTRGALAATHKCELRGGTRGALAATHKCQLRGGTRGALAATHKLGLGTRRQAASSSQVAPSFAQFLARNVAIRWPKPLLSWPKTSSPEQHTRPRRLALETTRPRDNTPSRRSLASPAGMRVMVPETLTGVGGCLCASTIVFLILLTTNLYCGDSNWLI